MSIVEEATRRLEQLARAGVSVPWSAAGIEHGDVHARVESGGRPAPLPGPVATVHRLGAGPVPDTAGSGEPLSPRARRPAATPSAKVTIDLQALEASGCLVPGRTRTVLAEEFRHLKRPLLASVRGAGSPAERRALIMVTSAMSGEGKTFCAINLAMSMAAEIDTSVLLVDADVVQPDLLQRLGVEPTRGLLDVLTDPDLEAADVVLATNVPKLSILPAGTPNPMSAELLASDAMERLLASLVQDDVDRVVIFDAPPLLLTSEAQVLASRVGQVVVVVEAGRTSRESVAHAFARLEQCPVVLPLLNKARRSALPLGEGYGLEPGPTRRRQET